MQIRIVGGDSLIPQNRKFKFHTARVMAQFRPI